MNLIKWILRSVRWGLVNYFSHQIEKGFLFKKSDSRIDALNRWFFSKLNTEKLPIETQSEILTRFDKSDVFFKAAKKSVLEREIAYTGEFYLVDFANPLLRNNSVCLDVGANSGVFSVPLAKRHPLAEFYCFEPHPQLIGRLKQNISMNNLENIIPCELAVSDNNKPLILLSQDLDKADNWGLSSTVYSPAIGPHRSIEVPCVTLDDFKKKHFQDKPVSFIKIDVQGAELSVLRGAKNLLKGDRPVVVFEHEDELVENPKAVKAEIKAILDECGYEVYILSKRFKRMFFPINWEAEISVDLIAYPVAKELPSIKS